MWPPTAGYPVVPTPVPGPGSSNERTLMTSAVDRDSEHPPIYAEMVAEQGNVPADVAATAERVLREAEQAVAGGRGAGIPQAPEEQAAPGQQHAVPEQQQNALGQQAAPGQQSAPAAPDASAATGTSAAPGGRTHGGQNPGGQIPGGQAPAAQETQDAAPGGGTQYA